MQVMNDTSISLSPSWIHISDKYCNYLFCVALQYLLAGWSHLQQMAWYRCLQTPALEYVRMAWFGEGAVRNINCRTRRTCKGRSPVRLSRGKAAGLLQIIRYDILITITAVKKMREDELSQEMLQKELSNTVSYIGKSKQKRTTQCSKNPN